MRYLLLPCALAACAPSPDNSAAGNDSFDAPVPSGMASPAPVESTQPARPAAPGTSGGLANDASPVSEAPFTADSAQGAANVVQTYYALIEAGRYAQAYRLWEPRGVGMTREAFAASFARYSEYHAQIGAPGRIDAGAGQRYVTVPVQVYGRLRQGNRAFNMRGDVILHRTEVDGATPEERAWRIRSTDIKPRPGEPAPDPSPPGTEDNRSTARYRCIDGSRLTANFDPDNRRVTIVRGTQRIVLRQERVASGIRYADGRFAFSGKGDTLTFESPGQPPLPCTVNRR